MRPAVRFLEDSLIEKIVGEARQILSQLGVEIHNRGVLDLLSDHGARVDRTNHRAFLNDELIDKLNRRMLEAARQNGMDSLPEQGR